MVRGGRSASDPDVLEEITGVRSRLVIEFKGKLEEVLRFRRYVGGYGRLSGRTDLQTVMSISTKRTDVINLKDLWILFAP